MLCCCSSCSLCSRSSCFVARLVRTLFEYRRQQQSNRLQERNHFQNGRKSTGRELNNEPVSLALGELQKTENIPEIITCILLRCESNFCIDETSRFNVISRFRRVGMTRLNSTFRSGCKLGNRTIREDKQPGQAYKLRRNSRVVSKKSRVFIEIDKKLARTCSLFRTTLHERPKRTTRTTSEKAIRVMDVARQSSMEEGLQVQLLSWKEKPDNLISDTVRERPGYGDKIIISRVGDSLLDSSGVESDRQVTACSQQDEITLGQLNGVDKIEACARSENRMKQNIEFMEKSLHDMTYCPQPEYREAETIISSNRISCDTRNLRSTFKNDIRGFHRTRNESGELNTISSANGKAEDARIRLKDAQVTTENRPNQLSSCVTLDKCSSNAQQNVCVVEQCRDGKIFSSDAYVENVKCEQKDNGIVHLNKTNLFDDGSAVFSQSSMADVGSMNGPELATNVGEKFIATNECTNECMIKKFPCDAIDHMSSCKSVSAMVGRPKRASRHLRSRHEDDYILDVRQIPHKFNDKISKVKKGNRKELFSGCKKRRRIRKQDACESVQGGGNSSEKSCTIAEGTGEEKYSNVDCVLGMRHDDSSKQQVLVQFTDGTSNWIKKSELSTPITSLCAYLSHPEQDLIMTQRLPSQWLGFQMASWKDRPLEVADFAEYEYFTQDNKTSRHYNTSRAYFSSKQRNGPSQNLLSSPLQLSKSSIDLAKKCKYFLEHDDSLICPDGRRRNSSELCSLEGIEDSNFDRYASNPLALNSLADTGQCDLKDFDDVVVDNGASESKVLEGNLKKGSPVVTPCRDRTFVSSDAVPIFVSRNGEIEVLQSDYIEIILKHKDKRSKRIRSETCDNLIHQLESRINDDKCQFIVINGLEDYFASSMDMEKLIKFPSEAEKTRYDEKMANLRYLFQTLKNYPKPVVAVISSAATGLAASLLSLVDVVYDQSNDKIKKNGMYGKPHLPVLAPKLMGLQHRNEALLMGESPHAHIDEQLKQVNHIFKSFRFSDGITSTLKEMRVNEKLSLERPSPKKRGRPILSKNNPKFALHSRQSSYNKTRLARLRCPSSFEENEFDESIDTALKIEIKKEQDLASQCLKELSAFWKEIADSACNM